MSVPAVGVGQWVVGARMAGSQQVGRPGDPGATKGHTMLKLSYWRDPHYVYILLDLHPNKPQGNKIMPFMLSGFACVALFGWLCVCMRVCLCLLGTAAQPLLLAGPVDTEQWQPCFCPAAEFSPCLYSIDCSISLIPLS